MAAEAANEEPDGGGGGAGMAATAAYEDDGGIAEAGPGWGSGKDGKSMDEVLIKDVISDETTVSQ